MVTDILNITKITSLALVNSVNPCQIAMLAMVLFAIITQNPEKRKKILYTGLAFVFAVYLGYLFYGLILIQLFTTFTLALKKSSIYFKNLFAVLAMIIGALNIKDYYMYNPGSVGTEMPLSIRPRAKLWIKRITSPKGAFLIGFIITLFLAPCTIAPYLVAVESVYTLGFLGALPWLLYFNFIVILPLLIITIIIYQGTKTVEDITNWKERNIKRLHLIAGILLFLVGISLLMRWL
ncbi:MAG: sulfite exporter TauE/SafE family protein [Nanoarchaeota archaeon]|nr:sulfite exporter TauE/SafE family protein [Nanoarchaeota archaeon]